MDEVIAYTGSIVSGVIVGVIVSLISLLLAERQRTKREKLAKARRRDTNLGNIDASCNGIAPPSGPLTYSCKVKQVSADFGSIGDGWSHDT